MHRCAELRFTGLGTCPGGHLSTLTCLSAGLLTPTPAESSTSTGVSCPHLPSERANWLTWDSSEPAWKGWLGLPRELIFVLRLGSSPLCTQEEPSHNCAVPEFGGDGPCVRSGRAWCGGSWWRSLAFATGASMGSCFGHLSLEMVLVRDIQA